MIIGALLVRNEAAPDRYLHRTLANLRTLCDGFVVVDDASTDDTASVCAEAGALAVHTRAPAKAGAEGWWGAGAEGAARALLWKLAAKHAGKDGWVYVADADHELVGLTPAELRVLCSAEHVGAWAFPLWDCWDSDDTHRVDGHWVAWRSPRVWLARACPAPDFVPQWGDRGIHAGHLPANYPAVLVGLAPEGAAIRHLGYVQPDHRRAKAARYLALAPAAA